MLNLAYRLWIPTRYDLQDGLHPPCSEHTRMQEGLPASGLKATASHLDSSLLLRCFEFL